MTLTSDSRREAHGLQCLALGTDGGEVVGVRAGRVVGAGTTGEAYGDAGQQRKAGRRSRTH